MFRLPRLPYSYHALEPVISARTLHAHHDHHHAGYVRKLNALIQGTELEDLPLVQIIRTARRSGASSLSQVAGQHYNHSLLWPSLSPFAQEAPGHLWPEFHRQGMSLFGSGWVWLLADGSWHVTYNGDIIPPEANPVLVVDVWEHAYYLDYEWDREAYLRAIWPHLNWNLFRTHVP